MSHPRRSFLARSAGVLCGAAAPGLLGRAGFAAPRADRPGAESTVLVVIQLSGGNDGLNTVVPLGDPAYRAARPTLAVNRRDALKIDAETGFHPNLTGFSGLLDDGALGVVRAVGYPNPDRSHFESMAVWHRGVAPGDEAAGLTKLGWLGRATPTLGGAGSALHVGGGEPPAALLAASGPAPSLRDAASYRLRGNAPPTTAAAAPGGLLGLVQGATAEAKASSDRVRRAMSRDDGPARYPQTGLAERLKLIARLIDAELPERIYYTEHGGFDTHAVQEGTHPRLLKELGDAAAAFQADLAARGQAKRVVLMAFSEFGRRVKENGSAGTDHGVAGPLFLIGDGVQPGLIGPAASLTDLDEGDLKWKTDFRTVYAALLQNWLGVDAAGVLGQSFDPADVLAA
ncbi:MAG: DUF1501 domain-containing protein [Planctomycetota bacterium]